MRNGSTEILLTAVFIHLISFKELFDFNSINKYYSLLGFTLINYRYSLDFKWHLYQFVLGFHAFRQRERVDERSAISSIRMASFFAVPRTARMSSCVAVRVAVDWFGNDFVDCLLVTTSCERFKSSDGSESQSKDRGDQSFSS